MKSVFHRVSALAAELFTVLLVSVGCIPKETPEPAKPPQIRWRGPGTNYEGKHDKPIDPTTQPNKGS